MTFLQKVVFVVRMIGLGIILLVLPFVAFGQSAELLISGQTIWAREKASTLPNPSITIQGYHSLKDKWSVWGYAYASPEIRDVPQYGSITIGPYYDFNQFFGCGVGGGVETFAMDKASAEKMFGRVAGSCKVGMFSDMIFLERYVEYGASGIRYQRTEFLITASPIGVGVLSQTGMGTGPQFIYSVPDLPIQFRAVPIMFTGGSNHLFSVEFVLRKEKE